MFRQDLQNSELRTFWITGELNYELLQVEVVVDLLTVIVYCLAKGKVLLRLTGVLFRLTGILCKLTGMARMARMFHDTLISAIRNP